jgi:hypothetical protein
MAEQKSFWNSVPGYLTGFAALLTALVGLARYVGDRGAGAADAHRPPVAQPQQSPARQQSSAPNAAPLLSATAERSPADCPKWLGRWNWTVGPVGGVVSFTSEGSASWYARSTDPAPGLIGNWVCSDADSIVLHWPNGYVDRLALAADGRSLSGTNQIGVIITGVR